MSSPLTTARSLMAALVNAAVAPMRSMHTPGPEGIVGDPYARGYLESADACLLAIQEVGAPDLDTLIKRLHERCQALAEAMPAYVKRGPDGTWLPGSPYDQGRVDGALRLKALIGTAILKEETA